MNHQELIERLRKAVISPFDLGPVADAIESLLNALDVAEGEVRRTAAERDAALAELAKYRDAPVVAWQERQQTKTGYTGWYDSGAKTSMGKGPTKSEVINGVEYQWRPLIVKPEENK